jgi:ribonuclease T2
MRKNNFHLTLFILLLASAGTVQARHHHARYSDDSTAGQFDYYLLSLSWAPTYCLTHTDDSAECGSKGYGFVVHGLWPQFDAGGYPERCQTQNQLTPVAEAKGRTVYPSAHLMQHEWQEHGTCSGLDALSYFQLVDRATATVTVPQSLQTPDAGQNLDTSTIASLFQRANGQMPFDAFAVACSRAELSEVRVCLTKNLAIRACGRGVRSTCPRGTITIPASR